MTSLSDQYLELIALTEFFLLQNFSRDQRLFSSQENYEFFKQLAQVKGPHQTQPLQHRTPVQQKPNAAVAYQPVQAAETVKKEPVTPLHEAPKQIMPVKVEEKESEKEIIQAPQKQGQLKPSLELDPLVKSLPIDLSDIRNIMMEKFPHQKIIDSPPNDELAKKISNAWSQEIKIPPILILSLNESPMHKAFLENLATALTIYFGEAKFFLMDDLECVKIFNSKDLRFIIANRQTISASSELNKHYREAEGKSFINQIPLFLLSDTQAYLKEPRLKATLWKALSEFLK